MAEYVVPVPTQCNPHRFLLHRDMLIHAVMCWNRALDYVQNVLDGTLAAGMQYITFEDFEPADLSPFYPLTTRDMRIYPDQHWKPDARVDRSLWQRMTDYIRGIVTTNGAFLRDRIGTGGGYTWERGGPIKTNPDDPETWQYKSGDQDLLRGMQSGRYRPADWLYLNIVGEYHRLVGETINRVEIIRYEETIRRHTFIFRHTDGRNIITKQTIVPPAEIVSESITRADFSPPELEVSTETTARNSGAIIEIPVPVSSISELDGEFDSEAQWYNLHRYAAAYFTVVTAYNWPSSIPRLDYEWSYIQREADLNPPFNWIRLGYDTDPSTTYIESPVWWRKTIAKRVDGDVQMRLYYKRTRGEMYGNTQFSVTYNGSTHTLDSARYWQYFPFTLSGPRDSEHVISVSYSSYYETEYEQYTTEEYDHDIYLRTRVHRTSFQSDYTDIIGNYNIHRFRARVIMPLIAFKVAIE